MEITSNTMKQTYYQMISDLKGYAPKDSHFTSFEEIEKLDKHFGLEAMDAIDLQNLRDMFMFVYINNHDWFSATAVMSVTTVIDHFIHLKGGIL